MSTTSISPARRTLQARSMGVKLITVGILALVMTLPALFVDNLVEDRARRSTEVARSIGSSMGGPQTFLGPVLAMPYTMPDSNSSKRLDGGLYVIFPARGNAEVTTKSEVRRRSLFQAPVYTSTINFKAFFDIAPTATTFRRMRSSRGTGPSSSRERPIFEERWPMRRLRVEARRKAWRLRD